MALLPLLPTMSKILTDTDSDIGPEKAGQFLDAVV